MHAIVLLLLLCLAACRSEPAAPAAQTKAAAEPAATAAPAADAATAAGAAAIGAWLDRPLESWVAVKPEIPRAPAVTVDDATKERCQGQVRPPTSPEDRLVAAAGWTLFGPMQVFGPVTMLSGMATVDGMCRPRFMQTFVFKNGAFAGTISPQPMESRTDGAQRFAFLTGEDYLVAEFARYAPDDALCCPSRYSLVNYRLKTEDGVARLMPLEVTHKKASDER